MAMSYVSTEIIQLKVTFQTIDGDEVRVLLTDYYGWDLTIPGRKTFTIGELKEMIELLYSEEIIKRDDTIKLCIKGMEAVYIRGANQIEKGLIEGI